VRTLRPALVAVLLATPAATHADATLPAAPRSACETSLRRAEAAFVKDVGGDPDGFTVTLAEGEVRVRYFAVLDMCGIEDDYRARATTDARIGFRVVADDGRHAGAFESRLRPALRACLATR
jgi:hypothetical protein